MTMRWPGEIWPLAPSPLAPRIAAGGTPKRRDSTSTLSPGAATTVAPPCAVQPLADQVTCGAGVCGPAGEAEGAGKLGDAAAGGGGGGARAWRSTRAWGAAAIAPVISGWAGVALATSRGGKGVWSPGPPEAKRAISPLQPAARPAERATNEARERRSNRWRT